MPEEFKDNAVMVIKAPGDKWIEAIGARMAMLKEGDKIVHAGFDILLEKNPR